MRRRPRIDCRVGASAVLAEADAEAHVARGNPRQPFLLHVLRRAVDERERCHHDAAGERRESRCTAEHFCRDRRVEHTKSRTAEAFRHQQAGEAKFHQAVPQRRIEAAADIRMPPQRIDRHVIRQQPAQ